jgi:sugar phosphate permease
MEKPNKNKTQIKMKKPQKIQLSRCYRLFLFFIMINIDGTMDISSGIFSSSAKQIKKQLKLNDAKFGGFGTASSIGRIISSFLFFFLNQKVNRKYFIIILLSLHSLFLFCFKFTDNFHILIVLRSLHGVTQTSPSIYIPVWINQFGLSEYKTVQITSIQLSQAIGKLLGHFIIIMIGFENWQNGFIISGAYLLILAFCCLISNENYFSKTLYPRKNGNDEEINSACTIFEEQEINKKKENRNYFLDLMSLLKNPLYILSLICRSIIRGLITCLHYWFSDFLRNLLKDEKPLTITISYGIICFTGPFGGIIANSLLKPFFGSYESRKSSFPLIVLQIIASIFAIAIGLMRTLISICSVTILFLIFNSSVIALVQGILISCVDKNLSATGFAFANACTQILTAGPTPMIYGMINDKFKDAYPWLAMLIIMSLNLLAVPLLIFLAILRNQKFDEMKKEKEKELIEINDDKNKNDE